MVIADTPAPCASSDGASRPSSSPAACAQEGQSSFRARLTREAEADLERLFDSVLGAGFTTPRTSPFTCRKAADSPFLRELIIPFGRSGYIALFEIESATDVVALAVRHQIEDDCH